MAVKETTRKFPAEWEQHRATVLAWPHNSRTWPGVWLNRAEKVFREFLETVLKSEEVWLICANSRIAAKARELYESYVRNGDLQLIECPINDMWVRDSGPICMRKDEEVVFLNFAFNAWGGKYPPWEDDNLLPERLARYMRYPVEQVPLTLEGGAVETNGSGTMITTESVLLHPNRRNGTAERIEELLRQHLGIEQIIWLAGGLEGDDTDGHVDDLVRFVNHSTVAAVLETRKSRPNYEILQENYRRLKQARTAEGEELEIITLPMPETYSDEPTADGSAYLPASYANYYLTNHHLILPLYDERFDNEMITLFGDLFPEREVIGIPARDLVWGQGSFHCISREIFL